MIFSFPYMILGLPLLGMLFLLFVTGSEEEIHQKSRHVGIFISGTILFVSLFALAFFVSGKGADNPNNLDALSLIFVLMIAFLSFFAMTSIKGQIQTSVKEFVFLMLLTESFMLFSVCSKNAIQFFVFWEAGLVPLFLMTAVWGAEKKIYTAYKFCFLNLAGAVFLFPVFFLLYKQSNAMDFATLSTVKLDGIYEQVLLVSFLFAMALKAPLFPFHGWLGETQAEAPIPAAILLCGVFSKIVFYAFLRLVLPIAADVMVLYSPYLIAWAVFSSLFAAFVTLTQTNMKKIAGFAHLTQVGFLATGVFCFSTQALTGVVFLFVAQGLAITGYLLICGALYHRFLACAIKNPTGLKTVFPVLSQCFFVACLAVLALPPLMPFTGQFLIFSTVFERSPFIAVCLLLSIGLLYVSFFKLFVKVLYGDVPERSVDTFDITLSEKVVFGFIGIVFIGLSLVPEPVFHLIKMALKR